MRSLQFPKSVWVAGLFLVCLLGSPNHAGAGPYDNLSWKFSVPVKLKNIMPFMREIRIRIKVFGTEGQIAEFTQEHIPIPPDGNLDTVVVMNVKPFPNTDPFKANRYVVDFFLSGGPGPVLCTDPTLSENAPIECRALPGTELVSHLEAPMPTPVNSAGGGAAAVPAQVH